MTNSDLDDRAIVITRVVDAPCTVVWRAMTDPAQIVRWWGPRGFTTTIHEMNLVPGGAWEHVMHGPDGVDYPSHAVFQIIEPPHRLVFTHGGSGPDGLEADFIATWSFEPREGGSKTLVTIYMLFPTAERRNLIAETYGAVEGGHQTLERLGEHLAETAVRSLEVTLVRIIEALPYQVFQAWLDPMQLARWWGPRDFSNPVCETDPRVGGAWRIVMRAPDGTEFPCHGVYLELTAPELLVFTNIATDRQGNPILDGLTKVEFAANGARTKLTLRTLATALVPEAAGKLTGMEQGWGQSLDRLLAEFVQ